MVNVSLISEQLRFEELKSSIRFCDDAPLQEAIIPAKTENKVVFFLLQPHPVSPHHGLSGQSLILEK